MKYHFMFNRGAISGRRRSLNMRLNTIYWITCQVRTINLFEEHLHDFKPERQQEITQRAI